MYLIISFFGFEGRIWDLIVSVPEHYLSFYFSSMINFESKLKLLIRIHVRSLCIKSCRVVERICLAVLLQRTSISMFHFTFQSILQEVTCLTTHNYWNGIIHCSKNHISFEKSWQEEVVSMTMTFTCLDLDLLCIFWNAKLLVQYNINNIHYRICTCTH